MNKLSQFQIIIFNINEIAASDFMALVRLVFKEDQETMQKFFTNSPEFWVSSSYNLEVAEVLRSKLLMISGHLNLSLAFKLEEVK